MRFLRSARFALANVASLLMFFGMFVSILLLAQFFQTAQGQRAVVGAHRRGGVIAKSSRSDTIRV